MPITYEKITPQLLETIITQYTDIDQGHAANFEKIIRGHIHLEEGSYSVVALQDGKPVGFISTYTKSLKPPLDHKQDAYIDIIEVATTSRRQGIARTLVTMSEAIPMWYNLGFAMCPAQIWIEWCKEVVEGYYVAKPLVATAVLT